MSTPEMKGFMRSAALVVINDYGEISRSKMMKNLTIIHEDFGGRSVKKQEIFSFIDWERGSKNGILSGDSDGDSLSLRCKNISPELKVILKDYEERIRSVLRKRVGEPVRAGDSILHMLRVD